MQADGLSQALRTPNCNLHVTAVQCVSQRKQRNSTGVDQTMLTSKAIQIQQKRSMRILVVYAARAHTPQYPHTNQKLTCTPASHSPAGRSLAVGCVGRACCIVARPARD